MRVLLIGSGGREHALAWKLAQSPSVETLYCAPGNPGIAECAELVAVENGIDSLTAEAVRLRADLVVVGPEQPLAAGIVDELQRRDIPAFGPMQAAACLESSKVFAKDFMRRHSIPTAESVVAIDAAEARKAASRIGLPLVLKADGLAAGKGVLIVDDEASFEAALTTFFEQRRFGSSGDRVLVEPFLVGEEVSYMGLADGRRILPLATSKDYKRVGEGDTGLNTGGMGAHSPAGVLPREDEADILHRVMQPVVDGMAAEGTPLVGVVYAGLMLTADGPQVLEYNIRFGDPECQPLMLRFEDDLARILADAASGGFRQQTLRFSEQAAACVVLASRGYPGAPAKGDAITGIEEAKRASGVEVFHAGTAIEDGRLVASGGRVLNVCARGDSLEEALATAYQGAEQIQWDNKMLRRDIGARVVASRAGS